MRFTHLLLIWLLAVCVHLSAQELPRPVDIEIINAITYATMDGQAMRLDLYRPLHGESFPVILAIHGGNWAQGDRRDIRPLAEQLAGQGYAVAAMSYRLAPAAVFPAQLEDTRAAARWLRENAATYRFDMERFAVAGISAGGQLAALLGVLPQENTPRPRCVVDFFGPMDLTVRPPNRQTRMIAETYLGASQQERPDLYVLASPSAHVTKDDPPFFIAHGVKDRIVPFSQSENMVRVLQQAEAPVTFVPMRGVGHTIPAPETPEGREVAIAVFGFLDRCLQPATNPAAPETEKSRETP